MIPFGSIPQQNVDTAIDRKNVKWFPQAQEFVKIKFDDFSRGNLCPSGIGICICDQEGDMCSIKSLVPQGTNNNAEAYAILHILLLSKRGDSIGCIEDDSRVIVNACIKIYMYN